MSEDRKTIGAWEPQQYSGYERRNRGQDVDFDGEHLEVIETVSGYGGYASHVYVPLDVLKALLTEKDLHIVDAKDKALLDSLGQLRITVANVGLGGQRNINYGDILPTLEAELARREGK